VVFPVNHFLTFVYSLLWPLSGIALAFGSDCELYNKNIKITGDIKRYCDAKEAFVNIMNSSASLPHIFEATESDKPCFTNYAIDKKFFSNGILTQKTVEGINCTEVVTKVVSYVDELLEQYDEAKFKCFKQSNQDGLLFDALLKLKLLKDLDLSLADKLKEFDASYKTTAAIEDAIERCMRSSVALSD